MATESQVILKKVNLVYKYQQRSSGDRGRVKTRTSHVNVIYGVDKRTGVVTAYQNNGNSDLSNTKPSDLTAVAIWGPTRGKSGSWTQLRSEPIPTSAPNDPTWNELIESSYGNGTNEDVFNENIKQAVNEDLNADQRKLVNFPGVNQESVDTDAPTSDQPTSEETDKSTVASDSDEDIKNPNANIALVRGTSFGVFTYPKELPMKVSDLMQFQIVEYKTLAQSRKDQSNTNQVQTPSASDIISPILKRTTVKKDIKGTINLAIQPPLSDTNGVNWTDTGINLVQLGIAAGALGFIQGGIEGATGAVNSMTDTAAGSSESIRKALQTYFAGKASQTSNLLSRLTGSVLNPNLETLFEGPRTRSFNYQFQFTPRDEKEAVEVRSIIRTFKEAMAIKRTVGLGFLKAPYVFNIRYLYKGENVDHPYIGRVKGPCALKDMQTDYTPEGSYMTYEGGKDGGSMVKYTVTMVFQELDPIYADDYVALGNENVIGY